MHEVLLLNTTKWLRTAEDLGSPVKTFFEDVEKKGGVTVDLQGSQGHGMEPCNTSQCQSVITCCTHLLHR